MKLVVTGASGLLGRRVVQLALKKGHEVHSLYKDHRTSLGTSIKVDLTEKNEVFQVVSRLKPETVIHTAAYTDVDGCEIDRDRAWNVNAKATEYVASAATRANAHLVYLSTDYVFDGKKGLYSEEDNANPLSYYGYTKLQGEEAVKEIAQRWCITRTSVIYGWGPKHTQTFATWLITNLTRGDEVKIVTDQYVSPTLNTNLADMLLEITERKITGILHTAGATRVSRYEFALKLAETFGRNKNLIKPARMNEIPWKAKRPKDSSLNVRKARTLLNAKPLRLNQALETMRKEGRERN